MDKTRAWEIGKEAAEQAGKTANDAAQHIGEQLQPALDQGKAAVQDLANRGPRLAGRPWTGRESLSRVWRRKPDKWRAISTTRVLGLDSTSGSMLRKNPSPRCWWPA